MADEILTLGKESLTRGDEEAWLFVFFYRLDPPLLTERGVKIIPTPERKLTEEIGEAMVSAHVSNDELLALDAGDLGYEVVPEKRKRWRDPDTRELKVEPRDAAIERIVNSYPASKAQFIRLWTKEMRFAGRRFDAPPE